ncbi:D-glycerate dehydrogenase [Kordiimonas sp. SCSIO 12603]|uniref:2-hydroxyacid dehydrogenase n=1 Tax=Kordiimonas sp. SCSIO 12603 TaxID=2829596 RepID=UPI002102B4C5|nr:D-glycerate dehydrogenase [Kordiimonas sp. SCSIO 12603]UTW58619.1 D-glycerate dehydrogenase [Kordiimonas sp. SCSIO 12603]
MSQTGNRIRPKVIVTRKLPDSIETRMAELFDVTLNLADKPLAEEQLKAAVAEADVLVPTVTDSISAEVLAAAGDQLKLIANFGAGVDHIDMAAAKEKGIAVTNTPGVLTEDTADLTMALLLSVPRRIFEGEKILRAGEWSGWTPTFLMGHRIQGKRLGIIGMGRIGQAVARRAKAFNMAVHYHKRSRLPEQIEGELEATYWEDLDEMLSRMDFISINCPLTDETFRLLNRARLKKLQPHAIVINTARGEVVDEEALADLIEVGRIAGAGLDVFEEEPTINPKLLELENVVLLPHMGSATIEARVAMGEKVLINIRAFADKHRLPDRVIPD